MCEVYASFSEVARQQHSGVFLIARLWIKGKHHTTANQNSFIFFISNN